ncbi:methyltransferase family protein [Rhizobium sullae]|uniref:Protein-S-isoprenylcysteine O-methyltransferase Ste14 n=1 Tax=Rhizobium sullae TaxID=50338 RepID=A0A4R3QEA7_RHISU|nr:isoprenylcysteine carboxylmethyltransferase family protein [Rhizobium sullae]TCU19309.1 protein-S-isoprenylcysteine O-methyltransferase Ste14 [Rhizobium sullae]
MTCCTTSSDRPFQQKRRIRVLWALTAAFIAFHLVARSGLPVESLILTIFDQLGILLIAFGIIGRIWSIIYVGGLKNAELVTDGPYSVTRNPLYVSSLVAISGVCLVFGSLLAMAIFTLLAYLVFECTAKREARYLSHLFGERYEEYARRTPLFWPDFSKLDWGQARAFSPKALLVTSRDALFILAIIPLSEFVEYLHGIGLFSMAVTVP